MTLHKVLHEFMMAPLFPVSPGVFAAKMEFRDFKAGETLAPGPGIVVRTAALNHPNGATGYRIEYGGKSVCYVTDTEHVPGTPDRNVLALIAGADIVIYDCMYTDEEFAKSYVGWGHSTWQEGLRLCKAAGAKRLVVFHHDPDRADDLLDAIGREAAAALPGSVVAREGLTLAP
jgi:phosphoribosyl 1,2-cyclic phosphodiesterase